MNAPKFFVGEPALVRRRHSILFGRIDSARFSIEYNTWSYTIQGIEYLESSIKNAAVESKDVESKMYGIFPFI